MGFELLSSAALRSTGALPYDVLVEDSPTQDQIPDQDQSALGSCPAVSRSSKSSKSVSNTVSNPYCVCVYVFVFVLRMRIYTGI